jgi:hypothetical protein
VQLRYRHGKGWERQHMKILQTMALATTMLGATASLGYCNFQSGSQLLDRCATVMTEGADKSDQAYCLGYIAAVADTFSCSIPLFDFYWKPSSQMTNGQLVRVVMNWLHDHPENLHFAASSVVANALQDAFPCK